MSEDQDRFQNSEDKERKDIGDKDVEGHAASIERASGDGETDEADVEGHSFTPGQTSPQTSAE